MSTRPTNIEGLCDALNKMGIRATVISRTRAKPNEQPTSRLVEKARRRTLKEIARISGNVKRLTTK